MKELSDLIDEQFYMGDRRKPRARTVGELKEQLNRLPDDLELGPNIPNLSFELVVYNVFSDRPHLDLREFWDYEEPGQ